MKNFFRGSSVVSKDLDMRREPASRAVGSAWSMLWVLLWACGSVPFDELERFVDADGSVTTYERDILGRVLRMHNPA
jgi:YD repeat-containing protein